MPRRFDVHTQFLFCSTALLDSSATTAEWSAPVLCDDLPDLNTIYRRSATKPANPGGSNRRTVSRDAPTDWHDAAQDVPAGAGTIWLSVGVRQAEQSQFTWSDPTQLEGAAGEDGEGIEWIHSLSADTSIPSGEIPSDSIAYDAARSAQDNDDGFLVGGRRWFDEQPAQGSAATPWMASLSRAVPGVPRRGDRPPTPLAGGWGPWRGPAYTRIFVEEPEPPVTVTHSTFEVTIPWDPDADDWATAAGAKTVRQQLDWYRGSSRVAECRVDVAYRPTASTTDDGAECRASLVSINTSVPSSRRLPVTFDGSAYRQPAFAAVTPTVPCVHTVTAGNVSCTVTVRLGVRPPALPQVVTASPPNVPLFVRQTGVTYTANVTWRRGSATDSASYKTVQFSVRMNGFNDTPRVSSSVTSGTLGTLVAGTQTGGGTVWTTPYTVEGVTAYVTVVVIDVGR